MDQRVPTIYGRPWVEFWAPGFNQAQHLLLKVIFEIKQKMDDHSFSPIQLKWEKKILHEKYISSTIKEQHFGAHPKIFSKQCFQSKRQCSDLVICLLGTQWRYGCLHSKLFFPCGNGNTLNFSLNGLCCLLLFRHFCLHLLYREIYVCVHIYPYVCVYIHHIHTYIHIHKYTFIWTNGYACKCFNF